ncbi:unnamed protein product (macronuclear) [Paramecium tetraurelia]|uniref:Translation initiation factor beta propellor-like domain-containing protein n=1 Tax=Paramecium tetraurelia TaxID=5888 RepID=A0CIH2_PARTE|nr:uncharacterized protein GSPATT00007724001 [Paramecium tetraurelia]CAK70589.1 unnamed protein product [Paramecium tetraurelia]|eukprot:XP_001437986.1 hypothetical protein (macronuclear) [Paramecium tetraurelia strain d4-2]
MSQLQDLIDFSNEGLPQEYLKKACEEFEKANKDVLVDQPKSNFISNLSILLIGLPKVKDEMKQKLITALKGFLKKNNYIQFVDIELNNLGQALLSYDNEDQAQQAVEQINNQNFDAKHQLLAFTQKQINTINETKEYIPIILKSRQELLAFHKDPRAAVTIIQEKSKLSLKWLNPLEKKLEDNVNEKKLPPYDKLQWSPLGQYLVLFTENEFSLYGAQDMELLHKFEHKRVSELLFSPDELYVISYDGLQQFIIWNIREERQLRQIVQEQSSINSFKFRKDNKLLAFQAQDEIQFYEAPEFYQKTQLNRKAVGVKQIEWVPQTNYLAVVCYGKDIKTQIYLHDYQRNIDVKWRNIAFEIESIQIFVHTYGKWVATLIKKKQKNKVFATTLQVGNLSKTDPFEIDEHTVNEDVENIFTELNTGKFALSYREKDKQQKPTQQFTFHLYSVLEDPKKGIKLCQLGDQKGKDTNELLWASNGSYFAMVNKTKNSPDQGKVEFGQISKKNEQLVTEITKSTNHFYMSHAQWDPTGIHFITMSDLWHSVNIWSSIGEQLVKDTITKVTDIHWRNKPIHILPYKEEQELQNNSKQFTKKYENEDDKILNKAKHEKEQKKKEMLNQFTQYLNEKRKIYDDKKEIRKKLQGWDEEDPNSYVSYKKVIKEEVVNS